MTRLIGDLPAPLGQPNGLFTKLERKLALDRDRNTMEMLGALAAIGMLLTLAWWVLSRAERRKREENSRKNLAYHLWMQASQQDKSPEQ